ncbi:hypothetical protein ACO0QE_001065 [Hanseniaspora vineae]
MSDAKLYTYTEIAEHNKADKLWMIIDDKVYDCTKFADEHPGGDEVLIDLAGQDATSAFNDIGHSSDAVKYLKNLYIGDVDTASEKPQPSAEELAAQQASRSSSSSEGNGRLVLALFVAAFAVLGYFLHKS